MEILKFNVFNFLNKSKKTTVPLVPLCPPSPTLTETEEANFNRDLLLFPLEDTALHYPKWPRSKNCPPMEETIEAKWCGVLQTKNQQGSKPFQDHKATIVALTLFSHNFPTDRARELFKPSTDSANLLVHFEKKTFSFWVWGSLWGTSQVGVVLHLFGQIYPALGDNPLSHF